MSNGAPKAAHGLFFDAVALATTSGVPKTWANETPVVVDICDVFHTQTTCSSSFRNGRTLEELIRKLPDGSVDPLRQVRAVRKLAMCDVHKFFCCLGVDQPF